MKKRRRRNRLSLGTIFMLLLTFLVLVLSTAFLIGITGGGISRRATEILSSFTLATEPLQAKRSAVISGALSAATAAPILTPTPTPAATATPVPQKRTIRIAAAGTVYAPKAIRETVMTGSQADFTPVFSTLGTALSSADLAIATLETTTAGSEKGYGNYNAPAELLGALRTCGVDLISLATERALDKGYEGLEITLQEMTSRGLSHAGVIEGGNSGATMLSIDGVQVAVLAYSYGLSDEGKEKTNNDEQHMLAMMDLERVRSDIARARMEGANLVVVLPHWGTKNKVETPETVKSLAQALAEAGADLIFGTHPNVVQGIERITAVRADGVSYETLVCYSLGSLLTDAQNEENTAGMIAMVDVTYDPVTRHVALGDVQATPVYISRTKIEEQMAYRVVNVHDETASQALDAAQQEAAARAAQIVLEATGQEK